MVKVEQLENKCAWEASKSDGASWKILSQVELGSSLTGTTAYLDVSVPTKKSATAEEE
jgi:hypothetical protein